MSSLFNELAVVENLQDHEPPANSEAPQKKERPQQIEPRVLARDSIRRTIQGHEYPTSLVVILRPAQLAGRRIYAISGI
jgi:hypothetical protein